VSSVRHSTVEQCPNCGALIVGYTAGDPYNTCGTVVVYG
jgi:predicted RNA-binding Zn-ribbon protein involved in translation (DUF1610 family)